MERVGSLEWDACVSCIHYQNDECTEKVWDNNNFMENALTFEGNDIGCRFYTRKSPPKVKP